MAHYNEMNDPMEGVFYYDPKHKYLLNDISEGKRKQLICCFSTDYKNTLLWSHYADSHQGCCLEVEVLSRLDPYEVHYSKNIPDVAGSRVEDILTHKSCYWEYEKEVRFFKEEVNCKGNRTRPYISVKINKVLLGYRMQKAEVAFYESLIHSILGDRVEVRKMKREELDTGLFKV